jgi:hypothetical protein
MSVPGNEHMSYLYKSVRAGCTDADMRILDAVLRPFLSLELRRGGRKCGEGGRLGPARSAS